MSPQRLSGSNPSPGPRPANAIHVVGNGLVAPVQADLDVQLGAFEADLVDLTPQDPLKLQDGTYAVHVRHAQLSVPADRVAALIRTEIGKQGIREAQVAFQAPDRAVVSGRIKDGDGWAPVKATVRLAAEGGKLVLRPLDAAITIEGLAITANPQAKRATLTTSGSNLLALLQKDIASVKVLKDVSWAIRPGNRIDAAATLILSGVPGGLTVRAGVQPAPDGQLNIQAHAAQLAWRGLSIEAEPMKERATVATTDAAVTRLIEEELDLKAVRNIQLRFAPGNRFAVTGEVREGGEFHPVRIEGRIEAKDGALRVMPELATVSGLLGGIDAVARPQTAQAEASVPDAVINRLVAPLVAKEGFADFKLALQPGNRFVLTGFQVDKKNPQKRKPVTIEGDLAMRDKETVKLSFRKIKYGGVSVDFGHLHVKALQALGLHLDDILKIDEPFLKLKGDALYLQPGKLTDKIQGEIEALSTEAGKLHIKTRVTTELTSLLPFKATDRFRTDGKSIFITPNTFTPDLAGTITGFETGDGTAKATARVTAADLKHIIALDEPGVAWGGNQVNLDLNRLQGYAQGQITRITTGEDSLTAELDADPAQALKHLPKLPAGLDVDGQRVALTTEAIRPNWHGRLTGVAVEDGRLRLTVGQPPRGGAHRIEAVTRGAFEIAGVRIEDAAIAMSDPTPETPLDPTRFAASQLRVTRGKAFVPRAKIEALLAERLAGKAPHGAQVSYVPGGLAVSATWKGLPISAQLALSAAGADGLAVKPAAVKIGPVPVPAFLAARLAGWLAKLPVEDGRLMVDVGKALGAELGPLRDLEVSDAGLTVSIGDGPVAPPRP